MGAPDAIAPPSSVILFDGVCNLCTGAVQFVISRDPDKRFRFASLQSPYGQRQLKRFGFSPDAFHSIILIEHGKAYDKSNAALRIARNLSGLWPLFYGFIVFPGFFRDAVYRFIAKHRYKLFGRKNECMIPDAGLRSRFLDEA